MTLTPGTRCTTAGLAVLLSLTLLLQVTCPLVTPAGGEDPVIDTGEDPVVDTGEGVEAHREIIPVAVRYFLKDFVGMGHSEGRGDAVPSL